MTPDDVPITQTDYRPPKSCFCPLILGATLSTTGDKITLTLVTEGKMKEFRLPRHVLASLIANGATVLV